MKSRFPGLLLAASAAVGVAIAEWLPCRGDATAAVGALLLAVACLARTWWILALAIATAMAGLHLSRQQGSLEIRVEEALRDGPRAVALRLQVDSPPGRSETRSRFIGRILCGEFAGVRVQVGQPLPMPAYGEELAMSGSLRNVPPPRNPGEFDRRSWLRHQGIRSELLADAPGEILGRNRGNPAVAFGLWLRAVCQERLAQGIAEEDRPAMHIVQSLALGADGSLPEELKEAFIRTGTFHLFSVSGLHVMMAAAVVLWLLRLLRLPLAVRSWAAIPMVLTYVMITGFRTPSLRAAIMGTCVLAGAALLRNAHPLNTLGVAAFALLLWDPAQLFTTSFQLSFTVLLGILLLARPLEGWMCRCFEPDAFLPRRLVSRERLLISEAGRGVAGSAAVSCAAWAASIPFALLVFKQLSLSAILANLIVVPVSFVILALALLACACPIGWLIPFVNTINVWLAKALIALLAWMAGWPMSAIGVAPENWVPRPASITLFDAGYGAAAAIETKSGLWFVDTGSESLARHAIVPWLRHQARTRIDGIFITHRDASHSSGFAVLDAQMRADRVYAAATGMPRGARMAPMVVAAGDSVSLGSKDSVEVLFPYQGLRTRRQDASAVVLRLRVAGRVALFLGDADRSAQRWIRLNHPPEACDLLIAGHSSDGAPIEEAYLDWANPGIVILTESTFPRAERINPRWLAGVHRRGIRTYSLLEHGSVRIELQPNSIRLCGFVTERKEEFDPEKLRINRSHFHGTSEK